jgi:hypothetical protein
MLKAWNTGHPGGLTTVHANGARAGLAQDVLDGVGVLGEDQDRLAEDGLEVGDGAAAGSEMCG